MHLQDISSINLERSNLWHGEKGIHAWSLSDWAVAMVGEAGEACNLIKKYNRLRDSLHSNNPQGFDMSKLGDEIADTFLYLDLLCSRAGLSLTEVVKKKFNEISIRENLPHRL